MKNRILAFLLCLALLIPMAGCSENKAEDAPSAPSAETENAPEAPAEVPPDEDEGTPPEVRDFAGYSFRVFNGSNLIDTLHVTYCDEVTGEPVSDEVYNRDRRVEELYDISIVGSENNGTDMRNSVTAGDDACDIALIWANEVFPNAQIGYLLDFGEVPGIDIANPWWDQRIDEDFGVGGKIFTMVGDYTLRSPLCEFVIQFNKKVLTDYSMEDPYQMVWDGSWTDDAMWEMAVRVTSDLNGDGAMDNRDMWGFITECSAPYYFFTGGGYRTVVPDADTVLRLSYDSEEVFNALEKCLFFALDGVNALCCDDGSFNPTRTGDVWQETYDMFTSNQCLFRSSALGDIMSYREMEMDFGVLPIPKMTETQDGYYCLVSCWDNPMVIPITVGDTGRTGLIVEALFYQSHAPLKSIFYETLLSGKLLRDRESIEMLDLIVDSKTFDLDWSTNITGIFNVLYGIAQSKTDTLSSRLASVNKMAQKTLDKFLQSFGE